MLGQETPAGKVRRVVMGQPGSLGHSCILLVLFCFIEVQLIYNVVVFSAVWQSDSVIQIHMYLCHTLFHYGLLPDIEYSVLCYTVGPGWSVLCTSLHLLISNSHSVRVPPPPPWRLPVYCL